MRLFAAIAAMLFAACALPAAARADGMAPAAAMADCRCARVVVRHHERYVRRVVRHRRHYRRSLVAVVPRVPIYFAWMIPSPLNPGYDRAMVLLFRSPAVSGFYTDDPGYPVTPVVAGVAPYERRECCAVFQYDGMTGQYIQLSQADSAHAPPAPPPGGVPVPLPLH